jgi:hypothetical protein
MLLPVSRAPLPTLAVDVDDRTASITIHELHPDGVRRVGTYNDAAAAWAAVDRLDSAFAAMSQPADCGFLVSTDRSRGVSPRPGGVGPHPRRRT